MKVLEPDPIQAPVVRMIFTDYVAGGLSLSAIREKLNADLDRYPPPESPDPRRRLGEWGRSSVWEILHNPKYTGYQVWNRRARKRGGKEVTGLSPKKMSPASGSTKPASMRNRVVLPQPDGPNKKNNSPAAISSVTSSRATVGPKCLRTA